MSRPQLTNNAKYTILPATSHSALAMSNWSLDLFPHSPEPSFLLRPLDRYETSLLLLSAVIPRNGVNLWIAMGLVSRTLLPTGINRSMSNDRLGICKKVRNLGSHHYYWGFCQEEADA